MAGDFLGALGEFTFHVGSKLMQAALEPKDAPKTETVVEVEARVWANCAFDSAIRQAGYIVRDLPSLADLTEEQFCLMVGIIVTCQLAMAEALTGIPMSLNRDCTRDIDEALGLAFTALNAKGSQ